MTEKTTSNQRFRLLNCIQAPEKGYKYCEATGKVTNLYGKILKGVIFLTEKEKENTLKILQDKKLRRV